MTRLGKVASVVTLLGVVGAYALHQRRTMTALERKQVALSEAVDLAGRNAQANRIEHAAFAALSQRLAPPADGETAPASETPAAPSGAHDEPPAPPPDPTEYVATIDSSFAAESADSAWDRVADTALRERLAAHNDHALRSIECRASMCRVITDDDSVEAASQRIRQVIANPLDEVWSGAYFSRVEAKDDGRRERVTYFFRKGVSLPVL